MTECENKGIYARLFGGKDPRIDTRSVGARFAKGDELFRVWNAGVVQGMSVLPLASGAHNLLESYDDKNNLSDVQMSVNSCIGITYDDKNNLGNGGTSELRYSVVQRKSNIPQRRSDECEQLRREERREWFIYRVHTRTNKECDVQIRVVTRQ